MTAATDGMEVGAGPDAAPPEPLPETVLTPEVLVVGAGPTGLYGAFCAGFRGLSTVLVDALPQVGGQIAALYPEKMVRDVAGLPAVAGRDLVVAVGGARGEAAREHGGEGQARGKVEGQRGHASRLAAGRGCLSRG